MKAMQRLGLVLGLLVVGCTGGSSSSSSSSSSGNTAAEGTERGPCRADGTCDPGLLCASAVCVRLPGGSSSGMVSSSGATSAESGTQSSSAPVSSGETSSGGQASSGGAVDAGHRGDAGNPMYPAAPACTVVSVNGMPGSGPVKPFDDVILGVGAAAVDGGSVAWTLQHTPPGSRARLTAPTASTTGFTSSARAGLDVLGTYVVGVSAGGAAATPCSLSVVAGAALVAEVTWDTVADMDIHLIRRGGPDGGFAFTDALNDCYYANCKASQPALPWAAADGGAAQNPVLVLDDVDGFGPERIDLQEPAPGDYQVTVDFFSAHNGSSPHDVGVNVRVGGSLRAHLEHAFTTEMVQWNAAIIHWPATGPVCIEALDDHSMACVDRAVPGTCNATTPCGVGTYCNLLTSSCEVMTSFCDTPADCPPARVCVQESNTCTSAECTTNAACTLPHTTCDVQSGQCVAVPPVCAETDEPNNTFATATPITATNAMGNLTLTGTLCRGDTDVLAFPAVVGRRALVSVTAVDNSPLTALGYASQTATPVLRSLVNGGALAFNTDVAGSAYLQLRLPPTNSTDQVMYTVVVVWEDQPACGTEAGEPNDSLATASGSVVTAGSTSRALCTETDQDFHLFHADANQRVTLVFDPGADFYDVEVLDTQGTVVDPGGPVSTTPLTLTLATSAASDFIIHVLERFSTAYPDPIAYTFTITSTSRPTCMDLAQEPNDTFATAFRLSGTTATGDACLPSDHDFYAFTTTAAGTITASADFPAGMDLDLTLYNAAGTNLGTAITSMIPEVLRVTNRPAGTYVLEVIPYTPSAAFYPAPYTVTLTLPTASSGASSSAGGGSSSPGSSTSVDGSSSASGSSDVGGSSASAGSSSGGGSSAS